MINTRFALCSLYLLCSPAFAVDVDCETSFTDPVAMVQCMEDQSFRQVTNNYKQLLHMTQKSSLYAKYGLGPLVESQKNWLKYRNSYCESYSVYHGEIYNHANCIIQLNNARAAQLENDLRVTGNN